MPEQELRSDCLSLKRNLNEAPPSSEGGNHGQDHSRKEGGKGSLWGMKGTVQ